MNRQLGPMITGSVVGIINGCVKDKFGIESDRWSYIYPNWEEENIFLVELDRQEKSVTIEEDEEGYENAKICKYLWFPREDLFLIGDLCRLNQKII